ncbi:hypothetical protein GPECTOR_1g15 [Gonium pectorale]|uniref:F-box domain-containing protein n=1 Tax=Gonium pectorale TaxID=33097 RepID=A0A150H288_GONPE|nr:hypothetical protein GPECTOR_1g15 [Gonium pectorale]|eukprot:KXZ56174.1 hypothetical protein GPECTOR_1g15 [Gonium pectorale]
MAQPAQPRGASRIWAQLPPELENHIISFLEPNDVACGLRLVNQAAAELLRGPCHTIIRLSQPVPNASFARRWAGPEATRGLTLRRRRELLRLTASSGSLPNLQAAVHAACCTLTPDVAAAAAAGGHLGVCQWLRQHDESSLGERLDQLGALTAAAGGGHRQMCEWLLANGFPWSWAAVEAAARCGHVGLAKRLLSHLPPTSRRPEGDCWLVWVAEGCDLPALKREWGAAAASLGTSIAATLTQPQSGVVPAPPATAAPLPPRRAASALAAAAGSPTPDWAAKVEWLESQGCPRSALAARAAATRPNALQRLVWLRGRGYTLDAPAAVVAARRGDAATLEYLLAEASARPAATAATAAAAGGHLAALRALHAEGCLIDTEEVVAAAARGGHVDVLAWLEDVLGGGTAALVFRGARTLCAAAESGSVELLAWLRERGCSWDAGVWVAAAEGGCEEALEWLATQGCPMTQDRGCVAHIRAAWRGDLATLRCLHRQAVPRGPPGAVLSHAVQFAPLPVVRWLLLEDGGAAGGPDGDESGGGLIREARVRALRRPGAEGVEVRRLLLRAERRAQAAQRAAVLGRCRRLLDSLVGVWRLAR